jgi:hypothetical protein
MASITISDADLAILKRVVQQSGNSIKALSRMLPADHGGAKAVAASIACDVARIAELLEMAKAEAPAQQEVSWVDEFYPMSQTIAACPQGLWQVGMVTKLANHRANAQRNDRVAESKLCNRLGQLRRQMKTAEMSTALKDEVKASVVYLRSVGRIVNFKSDDPRQWISTREQKTRW